MDKRYFQLLYLDKLQTAFIYQCAARKLKGFSEIIYDRFAEFSNQDTCHAIGLHAVLVAMDHDDPKNQEVTLNVDRIEGIGLANSSEEDEGQELFISMCKDWTTTLSALERRAEKLILEITQEHPDLAEYSTNCGFSVPRLMNVSSERIFALNDIQRRVQAGQFFRRKDENQRWRCFSCGYVDEAPEAPEKCPCCNAGQNAQVAGDWKIP